MDGTVKLCTIVFVSSVSRVHAGEFTGHARVCCMCVAIFSSD
jgi:hypothetical protein